MQYRRWLIVPLLFLVGLLCLKPIQLATADLGRHIINGQQIIENGWQSKILAFNVYSYTHPDYIVENHHWLFGVLTFFVHQFGGFTALSWLGVTLVVSAATITYLTCRLNSGASQSLLSIFLLIPLLTYRTEIRPELVSMVFLSLSLFLLTLHQKGTLSWNWLMPLLIVMQLIWVNTHIFFIFGIGLPIIFGLFSPKPEKLRWGILASILIFISLVNPHGLAGLLAPLTIFQTYEYQIVENQTLWFMIKRFAQPIYMYALIAFIVFLIGVGLQFTPWLKKRNFLHYKKLLPIMALSLIFIVVNFRVVRLLPFTGLILAPLLADALQTKKWWQWLTRQKDQVAVWSLGLPVGLVGLVLLLSTGLFLPNWSQLGAGLSTDDPKAIDFLQNQVNGPIFNNYDIGGMLIYALYPRLSVYTDNRPEAYPAGFFPNDYIEPQENRDRWLALLAQYDFQSIVFYRHDATPWGQPFLIERIAEDDWQPVYVDQSIIVLARNTAMNQELIKTYGLPKSMFSGNPTN